MDVLRNFLEGVQQQAEVTVSAELAKVLKSQI